MKMLTKPPLPALTWPLCGFLREVRGDIPAPIEEHDDQRRAPRSSRACSRSRTSSSENGLTEPTCAVCTKAAISDGGQDQKLDPRHHHLHAAGDFDADDQHGRDHQEPAARHRRAQHHIVRQRRIDEVERRGGERQAAR